jgi:serine/threonine protein kinase
MKDDKITKIDKLNKIVKNLKIILENIHGRGVAHMDFHEGNLMIDPISLEIKLIDFGECVANAREDDITFDHSLLRLIIEEIINHM